MRHTQIDQSPTRIATRTGPSSGRNGNQRRAGAGGPAKVPATCTSVFSYQPLENLETSYALHTNATSS